MVLAFLHTAKPNVQVFADLAARLDPSVPTRHELIEDVLAGAVGSGSVTDAMRAQTEATVLRLIAEGAPVVMCTCSTIGGVAEATPVPAGTRVMRIDRPMAEAAVASGRSIVVAATLPSTLVPTLALIHQVFSEAAETVGDSDGFTVRTLDTREVLCDDAWPHFERGDRDGYALSIARRVAATHRAGDIVVLAQASMAPAVEPLKALGIEALASPELGTRAAITAYRQHV